MIPDFNFLISNSRKTIDGIALNGKKREILNDRFILLFFVKRLSEANRSFVTP